MATESDISSKSEARISSGNRRADIQGLRAIAVLVVVCFHAGLPMPGGFVGVDVFFVISGFVITGMLGREWQKTGRIRLGSFYLRRFKRLTPALALMTAVTMLMSVTFLSPLGPQKTAGETAIGAMFLVANMVIAATTGTYFGTAAELNPLLHTWSLSVEEQFYLLFPTLVVAAWQLARKRFFGLGPLIVVGGVAVLSLAITLVGPIDKAIRGFSATIGLFALGFYGPVTRAWEFAVGALLALTLARWNPKSGTWMTSLGFVGAALLGLSVFLINSLKPFPGVWTLMPVIGTLMLLLAGSDIRSPTSRMLSTRLMVKIGDYSYSLYLWHWPLIVFAGSIWGRSTAVLVAAAVGSVIPAVLSYRWVEQPIRNIGGLAPVRWVRLVTAVVAPPLILGLALWFCTSRAWWSQSVARMQASIMPRHISELSGCNERQPMDSQKTARCTWNKGGDGKPIYVLGDSHASHFSEGIIQAGSDLNRPVSIATASSCPFLDVALRDMRPDRDNSACHRYVEGSLQYLKSARAGLVVISNYDEYWEADFFEAGETLQQLSNDPDRKVRALRVGLIRTIEALRTAGHQVLLVQTAPGWRWSEWNPARCTVAAIVHGRCTDRQTLEEAVAHTTAVRAVLAEVARTLKVGIFDSAIPLCPAQTCSTEAPGFTRYQDTHHISVPQSIELAPDFRESILSTAGQSP